MSQYLLMRIFYASQHSPNELDLPASNLWAANLLFPLRDLGHEIVCVTDTPYLHEAYNLDATQPADGDRIARQRPSFGWSLLDQVKAAHAERPVDVFFSYFASAHVEPGVIRDIRRLGIVTVNWYCNASYQFHLVRELAPAYDYCLVPERFRLDDYRQAGANPLYFQEAANPTVYRPHEAAREFDVTFVGQCYGTRPLYIGRLHGAGVSVRVWGPGWQAAGDPRPTWRRWAARVKNRLLRRDVPAAIPRSQCGPPLSDDDLVRMYSRSKITLGFSAVASATAGGTVIKQVRLRDFEATMSGAFYLVEQVDELADFFVPDREIVFFHDSADLIDKTRFYLRHSAERERIRLAGLRRARAEHTWQQRFRQAFRQMGLERN